MKKNFKLVLALVLALMMVLGSVAALAEGADPESRTDIPVTPDQTHTITINNPDEQAEHSYVAYQIFKGDLNADEDVLSNILWGDDVDGDGLLSALQADTTLGSLFADCNTALDVARVLAEMDDDAANLIKFSEIAEDNLVGSGASSDPAEDSEKFGTPYSIEVEGDGYYLVKDEDDTVEADGEHYTKFILKVVKNTEVVAKDTHTTSDKVIVNEDDEEVNDDDAAIGDTITYVSTLDPIPDPTRYNRYKLVMKDTMEAGLTFTGITSITIGSHTLTSDEYDLYVDDGEANAFTAPSKADAIGEKGDHTDETEIKIVFKDAKDLILDNDAVGDTLTVTYTAILNADAEIAPDSNDNTVHFEYSNNPNHEYDGDDTDDDDDEVKGKTTEKTVETYTTTLEILKTDAADDSPLAGAIFTIEAETFNTTLVTGTTFEEKANGGYWKLLDGSYTDTDPDTVDNKTQYEDVNTQYKLVEYEETVMEPNGTDTYTLISDDDGVIYLQGVKAGTYTITEITAPDGYNLLEGETVIKIDWNTVHGTAFASPEDEDKEEANGGFSLDETESTEGVQMTDDGAKFTITIQNSQGATLPSTGGMGTTIFYIAGSILVLAAAVLLVTKRRMGSND